MLPEVLMPVSKVLSPFWGGGRRDISPGVPTTTLVSFMVLPMTLLSSHAA